MTNLQRAHAPGTLVLGACLFRMWMSFIRNLLRPIGTPLRKPSRSMEASSKESINIFTVDIAIEGFASTRSLKHEVTQAISQSVRAVGQLVRTVEALVSRPGCLQSGAGQARSLVGVWNLASHVKQGAICVSSTRTCMGGIVSGARGAIRFRQRARRRCCRGDCLFAIRLARLRIRMRVNLVQRRMCATSLAPLNVMRRMALARARGSVRARSIRRVAESSG